MLFSDKIPNIQSIGQSVSQLSGHTTEELTITALLLVDRHELGLYVSHRLVKNQLLCMKFPFGWWIFVINADDLTLCGFHTLKYDTPQKKVIEPSIGAVTTWQHKCSK